jgi:hypothetical protein
MCHDIVSPFLFFFSSNLDLLPIQMLHKTLESEVRNSLNEREGMDGRDCFSFVRRLHPGLEAQVRSPRWRDPATAFAMCGVGSVEKGCMDQALSVFKRDEWKND